ncbi:mitochondrial ATP-dependent RNA helicase Suv3, putative [Talaromyces stipitatus ATCC 10500]|uniref:RNA helicase n=1 Tax=Talaromyces stipitatus (strain ATCC 10500 / CBS 375.48 / QM 6759 / NRRL 1006) TaxID=441959 RepID=B8M1P6_TALSN|nr:mitochondrial ATP-dependent RNA helicase Suv3, putative [Talaromyces stipitatus ATCC 10500]EED22133.1 mitochondrial ATP-dependent RNA helicase Suv3, putative [Talaromyces stipitatus ATCC 10500]
MKQPWTLRAGECLFCSFRSRYASAVTFTRPFTSTPLLERPKLKPTSQKPSGGFSGGFRMAVDAKFDAAVETALRHFKNDLSPSDPLLEKWDSFYRRITQASRLRRQGLEKPKPHSGSLVDLRLQLFDAYRRGGLKAIRQELKSMKNDMYFAEKYGNPHAEEQARATDLRYPAEWYPFTRSKQRTIHLHVGPTNSGKTYRALKRLEQAKLGFYAGPLRLLAQEVYTRFSTQGVPCSLVTGDEVRISDATPRIISNTVEMVSIYKDYDVGVIDEIQMIADPDRGWAWTRAFLGARAKELHVCGEERAVPLIKELTTLMGDNLEIHRYQRLNPLQAEEKSLNGDLRKLRKGDCIVTFSRINIHALKNEIEKSTGKRAAIVYGGLPAEIRTQQANLFNDPHNNYDFLVASDAIGMGLNLKCKRIIFQTLVKGGKNGLSRISIPEIKQIGGRAGRYRAANETDPRDSEEENVGLVTSLEDVDLPFIKQALEFDPPPLTAAGVIPTDAMFYRVASYFPPDVSFKFLVNRVCSVSRVHPLFFMCKARSQLEAAEILDRCDRMSIEDQLVFMASPLGKRDPALLASAKGFIQCVARNTSGRLLDIPELNLEILEAPVSGSRDYLNELESLHKSLILYLWLSYRMGGIFTDRTLATHVKGMVEERMMRALTEFSANAKLRKDASRRRQILLSKQNMHEEQLLAMSEVSGEQSVGGEEDSFDVPMEEDASSTEHVHAGVQGTLDEQSNDKTATAYN